MSKVALTLVVLGLVACSGGDPQEATPTGAAGTEASGGTGGSSGSGSGGSEAGGAAGSEASAGEAGAAGGPTPGCSSNADCADAAGTPRCDLESGQCVEPPAGHLIGWGDGSASSVDLTLILDPTTKREATDLAFHPTRTNELWVINREYASDATCIESVSKGCASLEGSVTIVFDPGTGAQSVVRKKDPNAWHFMRRPPAFAFGANDTMATCGEARTGNFLDDPIDYMGPALFSTDPAIFTKQPPGKNGSHLDMLHASPWCMGIAHEKENVYWVFNGNIGAIDRYDFKEDHGPGNEDHSDGELLRYGKGKFKRVPGVPSHMEFFAADSHLYIADTGNKRIAKLDTTSGTKGTTAYPNYDDLKVSKLMKDVVITDVVAPGLLEAPSGLALHGDTIYASDSATGKLHAFALDGTPLRSLDTGFEPGTLAGITAGPDGRLYFVDQKTSRVYRLDPK